MTRVLFAAVVACWLVGSFAAGQSTTPAPDDREAIRDLVMKSLDQSRTLYGHTLVNVAVELNSPPELPLNSRQIATFVERRLAAGGVTIATEAEAADVRLFLTVGVQVTETNVANVFTFAVRFDAKQLCECRHNGRLSLCPTWGTIQFGVFGRERMEVLADSVGNACTDFAADWKKSREIDPFGEKAVEKRKAPPNRVAARKGAGRPAGDVEISRPHAFGEPLGGGGGGDRDRDRDLGPIGPSSALDPNRPYAPPAWWTRQQTRDGKTSTEIVPPRGRHAR